MVLSAMNSGVSGLRAESEAISVVGDNIANVNTTGFKSQRVIFQDVLGHSILAGTASALPGSGVKVGDIQQLFTQGSLANTGVATDLALSGDGFFTVKGAVDGLVGNFYTRAGTFNIDKDGFLVNPSGLEVQGYKANPDGTFQASISSIQVPTAALPAHATENATVVANLDASEAVPALPFDVADPANTSNFSTTLTVYDSLGAGHTVDIYFEKTAAGAWNWHGVTDSGDVGLAAGTNTQIASGTLTFDNTGKLTGVTGNTAVAVTFTNAAAQNIDFNFGTPTPAGTGLDGITQFASPENVSSQSQDGYSSGDFSGVAVDGQGVVTGLYTNGQQLAVGQLAVAKFRSNDGLGRAGQNLWIETRDSGTAAFGTAGSGGRGAVSAGALEGSNVDLAEEFVGLIQHQRSFSANSKTITTADEMLQELINIKR
jgi:flagellar hook protein FlgE